VHAAVARAVALRDLGLVETPLLLALVVVAELGLGVLDVCRALPASLRTTSVVLAELGTAAVLAGTAGSHAFVSWTELAAALVVCKAGTIWLATRVVCSHRISHPSLTRV